MQRRLLYAGAILGSALPALAQNHLHGFTFNVSPGATTRGGLNTVAGELLARFDFEEYRGLDNSINGFQALVQDQDVLATPGQLFDVYFHLEDPANPNFPNYPVGSPAGTNAIGGVVGIMGPTQLSPNSPIGGAAYLTVTFNTPIQTTIDKDLFVSFNLVAEPLWPNDGLSVQISLGTNPAFPPPTVNIYDLKGIGPVAQGSYALVHNPGSGQFAYGGPRQMMVDLLTDQASGVVTAITNQPTYPISNTAPGTASFFSGLHPDTNGAANGGRVDDIGYVYFDSALPSGSVVVFAVDFAFLPVNNLPLSTFLAGSTGTACISPGLQVLSVGFLAGVNLQNVITIPAGARSLLGPTGLASLVFDAIGLDATNSTLHGGTCGMQVY